MFTYIINFVLFALLVQLVKFDVDHGIQELAVPVEDMLYEKWNIPVPQWSMIKTLWFVELEKVEWDEMEWDFGPSSRKGHIGQQMRLEDWCWVSEKKMAKRTRRQKRHQSWKRHRKHQWR